MHYDRYTSKLLKTLRMVSMYRNHRPGNPSAQNARSFSVNNHKNRPREKDQINFDEIPKVCKTNDANITSVEYGSAVNVCLSTKINYHQPFMVVSFDWIENSDIPLHGVSLLQEMFLHASYCKCSFHNFPHSLSVLFRPGVTAEVMATLLVSS